MPRKRTTQERVSPLEALFDLHLRAHGLPAPEREFRFHETRRWRFDFAWPIFRLAVELEGGIWNGGRHTRPAGYAADCEKYNAAAMVGWMVLRFTGPMIRGGRAVQVTEVALIKARIRRERRERGGESETEM